MSMTYYTVDDLRPGRSGWGVKRFSTLNDAISHYRTLPMDGARVLGMADDAHAYELIRCVRLFPGKEFCKYHYPFVYHHLWLLPFFWVWRMADKGISHRKKVKRELTLLRERQQKPTKTF